jgi:histidinol-phosphate aminotransferase
MTARAKPSELANPWVRELTPYPPGKPIEELERELGITGAVKLASNESPIGPSRRAVEAIFAAAESLNRYPDGSCHYLREALAERLGLSGDRLVFGAGSDELLELLSKSFLSPGDDAVMPWPSFAMYPLVVRGMGARAVQVPLDAELRVDVAALIGAVGPRTRLLFLANPNNPTGTSIGADAFAKLVESVPERVVIAADEAYCEYVRRADFPDTLAWLRGRPTLVVLRTFSKIHGLAGLRVGYGVGHPELIAHLARARHPFNVNSLAQAAARAALGDPEHVARVRAITHAGLERLERGARELGLRHAQSDANFLLIEVGDRAAEIYQGLLRQGVITRPVAGFGLDRHLRVTVGLPEENERFLAALAGELGRHGEGTRARSAAKPSGENGP